ncbi:hypothetical protein TNIN_404531 [Trichonephila inaurata madagascariensis]|uniref:Uncharacterized protein n=1 Tax=Trichonephila inaurata madagascariensis TaxID=2747483 RepID=A0A8X6III1_9ARAC|nr:hypothetical protein TNIN_404531 [Trichonephila inaurata madagascariensis]
MSKEKEEREQPFLDVEFINLYTKGDIQRKHLSKRYCCHNWATTSNIVAAPESSPINRQSRNNGFPLPLAEGEKETFCIPCGKRSREYLVDGSPADKCAYRGTVEGPRLGNLSLWCYLTPGGCCEAGLATIGKGGSRWRKHKVLSLKKT